MQTSTTASRKTSPTGKAKAFKVGDRVSFAGTVLRVLEGEARPLLIMIDANGLKVKIDAQWLPNGMKLRGGDPVTLSGTITRVWSEPVEDHTPISMTVAGYTLSRVTVGANWLKRA